MVQDWQGAYRAAMVETDQRRLGGKIDSATAVLRACLLELDSSAEEGGEIERIADALRTLELIRRVELEIPEDVRAASEETHVSGFHHRVVQGRDTH
jgi:hypothetical protein